MSKSKKNTSQNALYLALIGLIAGVLIWNIAMIFTFAMKETYSLWLGSETTLIVAGFLSAAIEAIAGGLVVAQLRDNTEAKVKGNEVNISEFYNKFITYWKDWGMIFINHPELRKYFYDGAEIDESSDDFPLAMAVATYMDDLFVYSKTEVERLKVNFDIMPEEQYKSYNEYMAWMKESPVYKLYVEKYRGKINRYEETAARDTAAAE